MATTAADRTVSPIRPEPKQNVPAPSRTNAGTAAPPWHHSALARQLIATAHILDAEAAKLEPWWKQLAADPAAIIGCLQHKSVHHGLAHDRRTRIAAPGGSAVEAILEDLAALRDRWIEARQRQMFPGDPYASEASAAHYQGLIDDTPNVDDAIRAWRMSHQRAAA